jgi:hypothetical protein
VAPTGIETQHSAVLPPLHLKEPLIKTREGDHGDKEEEVYSKPDDKREEGSLLMTSTSLVTEAGITNTNDTTTRSLLLDSQKSSSEEDPRGLRLVSEEGECDVQATAVLVRCDVPEALQVVVEEDS